jgi:hypothetical protein
MTRKEKKLVSVLQDAIDGITKYFEASTYMECSSVYRDLQEARTRMKDVIEYRLYKKNPPLGGDDSDARGGYAFNEYD